MKLWSPKVTYKPDLAEIARSSRAMTNGGTMQ